MRRDIRERRKNNKQSSNKSIYITGGVLMLAIATFIITFIVYSNKFNNDLYTFDSEYLAQYTEIDENILEVDITDKTEDTASASSSIGKTVEESEQEMIKEPIVEETGSNQTSNRKSEATQVSTTTQTNIEKSKEKEENPTFIKPIDGEILKEYAKDSLVYSETLKEWTTHLGIDIKAERATIVKSATDGIVKYIKNDPRYGLTIIIEHSNGFETRYANLLTTEFVSEGETIKAGQTIGTVGDSAIYEIVDESHLHFELLKDSESVNPTLYINF